MHNMGVIRPGQTSCMDWMCMRRRRAVDAAPAAGMDEEWENVDMLINLPASHCREVSRADTCLLEMVG